jgi:putative Holliday junction resolvase
MLKRLVALDCGDAWVGVAHTDLAQILCQPYQTWKAKDLFFQLNAYLEKNPVEAIVIGMPYTVSGGVSEQTKKVQALFLQLQANFPDVLFVEQDEKFSSRFGSCFCLPKKNNHSKDLLEHARAAVIILENYMNKKNLSKGNI